MKVHKDLKYIGVLEDVYYFREPDGSVVTGTASDMEQLAVMTGREEIAKDRHEPGPCAAVLGKKKPSLIDADMEQAAMGIRGAAAAIDSTIFADAEPFDPKQFVTDVIGS
jgi:hypothetical protein